MLVYANIPVRIRSQCSSGRSRWDPSTQRRLLLATDTLVEAFVELRPCTTSSLDLSQTNGTPLDDMSELFRAGLTAIACTSGRD